MTENTQNPLEIGGSSNRDLASSSEIALNDSGTCRKIDTRLTQNRSPGVLGWTYFVRVNDAIKIGSASNFKDRLSALQTAHEKPLDVLAVLPAALVDEYKTHQLFAHLRIRGEWFRVDRELLYFIEQAKAEAEAEPRLETVAPPKSALKVPSVLSQQQAIRRLINARAKTYGADTPEGHACSNLAEMLEAMQTYVRPEWATDVRQTLPWMIQQQMKRLSPRAV